MNKHLILIPALAALLLGTSCSSSRSPRKSISGNPVFEGWYADPEGTVFDIRNPF